MPDTTPKQSISLGKDPEIHVIPEQFYGVAGKAKLKSVKEVEVTESKKASESGKTEMAAVSAEQKIVKPKPASKKWLLIPLLAFLFVGGLGVGTWFLLKPPAEAPKEEKPVTSIQPSAPQPETIPEPGELDSTESIPESGTDIGDPSTPEPEPELTRNQIRAADEDEDGLTFAEEELFGTSDESNDSDGDGFTDLLEVVNLYNPSGFTPTRLDEAGLVKTHPEDGELAYQLLFPSSWLLFEDESQNIAFGEQGGDESVHVKILPNQEGQTLLDWFLNENPLVPTTRIEESTTKAGDIFITTPDDPTSYIAGDGVIYAISLESTETDLKFMTTYRMMVNSFTLTP